MIIPPYFFHNNLVFYYIDDNNTERGFTDPIADAQEHMQIKWLSYN